MDSKTLKSRRLGQQGLTVSALGLGCMGMSQSYGTPDDAESHRHYPSRPRAGRDLLRHRRGLRALHQRGAAGPGARGRRDRAVIATKFGFRFEGSCRHRPRQPAGAHPRGGRRVAPAARHRLHRPALPAPGRSGGADRGRRRHDGRARTPGQGPVLRPVRGRRRDASAARTPSTPSPRCRASIRCGSGTWRTRSSRSCASSASASCRSARSAAASSRARCGAPKSIPRATTAAATRGSRAPISTRTYARRRRWARSRPGSAPRPVKWRWPGCSTKGEDFVPIPGTKRRRYLEENVRAADLSLTAADLARLDDALPPARVAGPRYSEKMMAFIDR